MSPASTFKLEIEPMTNAVVFQSTIVVDHVTIQSRHAFDVVKVKLETLLPPLDNAIMKYLENDEAERAMQRKQVFQQPPLFGRQPWSRWLGTEITRSQFL